MNDQERFSENEKGEPPTPGPHDPVLARTPQPAGPEAQHGRSGWAAGDWLWSPVATRRRVQLRPFILPFDSNRLPGSPATRREESGHARLETAILPPSVATPSRVHGRPDALARSREAWKIGAPPSQTLLPEDEQR